MLKVLRKEGISKKILWVIAIIIIISFGFFGTAYLLDSRMTNNSAGKVFGKNISMQIFEKSLSAVEAQGLLRYGDNYKKIRQYLNLESETWDRLILLHESNRRKIKISNEEVVQAVQHYAFFQRDEKFDLLLYNDILRYVFRMNARDFEEGLRDSLKFTKLYEQITTPIGVAENEIFNSYKKQNEKAQVSYILIPTEKFKSDVPFNEAAAQEYFNANPLEFLTPPSINADYIQIAFPSDKQEEMDPIREKAIQIHQQLTQQNRSWEDVAKENSIEIQSTGLFSLESPNLSLGWPFETINKLFELSAGSFTEPFETSKGIYIARLKEHTNSHAPSFEEAKDKVKDILAEQGAKELAKKKADEYYQTINEQFQKTSYIEFSEAVKTLGFELTQTPLFTRGQYLPGIGIAKEFQEEAFRLNNQSKLGKVVEVPNGYCILYLDNYTPADEKDFEKNRENIEKDILTEKRNVAFTDFLNGLRSRAKVISRLPQQDIPKF
jgi:peptidyl-prolyl cis-trans isomerase D